MMFEGNFDFYVSDTQCTQFTWLQIGSVDREKRTTEYGSTFQTDSCAALKHSQPCYN